MTEWFKKQKFFWFGFILSAALLWPTFAAPYFTHHDDIHTIRLYEMHRCIEDGQIPCRWVPDMGMLYGYPVFNYYGPLPYYVGEIFYLLTSSLIISAKIIFALSFMGSYIFMFLLGKKLWGEKGGLISGVFYAYAPYHAVDFYVRGANSELWALMFFPAVFWAALCLKEKTNLKNSLLLGGFAAALVLSHNLSAMLFLPMTAIFVSLLYLQDKDLKFIKFAFLSLVLSVLLSAFYLLPMTFEKNLVHVETTTYGYFSYTEHFKGLKKLLLDRSWGWGASVREVPGGERDGMSFQIGWVHLLGWALALFAAFKAFKTDGLKKRIILFSTLFALFSIFMVNPRSEFVWKLLEPLKYLQFPWRFLEFVIFFVSLISGSTVFLFRKYNKFFIPVLLILVVAFNFYYFRPEKFRYVTDQQLLSGTLWESELKRSIFDFLPIYAKAPPAELAGSKYQVLSGVSFITGYKQGSDWITFKTDTKTLTLVRLSQYYFPDWKIKIDGREVPINYHNDLGLMTFAIDPGVHEVEARLFDTPIRRFANALTVLGFVLFFILLLTQVQMTRKWIIYVAKQWYK